MRVPTSTQTETPTCDTHLHYQNYQQLGSSGDNHPSIIRASSSKEGDESYALPADRSTGHETIEETRAYPTPDPCSYPHKGVTTRQPSRYYFFRLRSSDIACIQRTEPFVLRKHRSIRPTRTHLAHGAGKTTQSKHWMNRRRRMWEQQRERSMQAKFPQLGAT